jgi:type IV pilus assembly protein PilQ
VAHTVEVTKEQRMNAHGHYLKSGLLALLLVAGSARAATPVSHISGVEAVAGGRIAIHGSQKPTFTAFKLAEPPRLVVDLTGADVTALPHSVVLTMPGVLGVSTAQFDEGGRKVARLVVALDGDVRYDVAAQGNDLLVSIGGKAEQTAPATAPAQKGAAAQAASDTVSAAPAEVASATATAPAADPNLVLTREDKKDVKHPAHKLGAVTVSSKDGQAHVRVATDGEVGHYTLIELQNPGRLALDLQGVTATPPASRKLDGQGDIKSVRVAKREGGVRVVVDGQADRLPPYEVSRRADGLEVTMGARPVAAAAPAPKAEPVKTAAAAPVKAARPAPQVETMDLAAKAAPKAEVAKVEEKPAPKAEPKVVPIDPAVQTAVKPVSETGKVAVSTRFATVKAVDLRTDEGKSELAVVIDGAYTFEVGHPNATSLVLTLRGVTLPERLERNLDATALGGVVDMISSYHVAERPGEVKVIATLRSAVKDEIEPSKQGLRWKFGSAPVAQAPAAAPARAAAMASEAPAAAGGANVLDDRNYTGRRVDLNVKDIDIRNLLSFVSDISKKNIILADDVKGTVTIKLRNVPWDQALDIILKSKALGKEELGNIIRVAPLAQLRSEQKEAADAAKVKQTYEPLKVRLIAVNYATAEGMVDKVKDALTERGTVSVDKRTNTLIVKDVADSLLRAEGIVRNLDTQTPEVLIESRIVEASTSFSRSVGVQWGGNVAFGPTTGNPTGLVFPSVLQLAGAADDSTAPITGLGQVTQPNFAVNMPAPIGLNSGGGLGMVFGSAGGAANLNLRLSAAENSGTIKTISSPRVVALDNVESSIGQGVSIPFAQTSAAGVNTQFIEAKLELRVTPHVTQEGSIQMKINATNNQPNPQLTGSNGQPSISRREAKTEVLVKDGDTTVIGGIYTRSNSDAWNEVPVLSRIPIIGWLFKKKAVQDARTELLIFITPRIVNRSQSVVASGPGDNGNQ